MKRIVITMMAMVMMFTMFGSVTANAAKRDVEIDAYLDYDNVVITKYPMFTMEQYDEFYLREEGARVEGVEHTKTEFMLKYAELHDMTDINEDTVCVSFGYIEYKYDFHVGSLYFMYRDANNKNRIVFVNNHDFWEVIYAIGL